MKRRELIITRIYSILLILLGIWSLVVRLKNIGALAFSFRSLFPIVLAFLYITCGIGLYIFRKWAIYLFFILMLHYLYRVSVIVYTYIYRLKTPGGIFSIPIEILISFYMLLNIFIPAFGIYFFVRQRVSNK